MTKLGIPTSLLSVALLTIALATPTAHAGVGGSAAKIRAAAASGSTDAILAEVERAEHLVCAECVDVVTGLLDNETYEVREVAAWWFAKRPALKKQMIGQMTTDLAGDSIQVRNAADFLGTVKAYDVVPQLQATFARAGVDDDAQVHLVMAIGAMGDIRGDALLTLALADDGVAVRRAAVDTWRDLLNQKTATPIVGRLTDDDAVVRAKAATVVGAFKEASGRAQLEALATSDADPFVRRNAAWALGEIGQAASRTALTTASTDTSGIVRGVARASLAKLH